MDTTTPMLTQYQTIKSRHRDCILFFRLGDFYEMFFDDAKVGSRVLELVLTSRGKGTANQIPMCGVPYHAADGYIAKLIKAGHKVAICEQVEDPALAQGIVKRDVIRVITSGTFLDEHSSDSRYIFSLNPQKDAIGIAFIDPTTGTIQANEYENPREGFSNYDRVLEIIGRLAIYECIFPAGQEDNIKKIFNHPLLRAKNITLSAHEDWCFNPEIARKSLCEHFAVHNLRGFGIEDMPAGVAATGALLEYLKLMTKQPLRHIDKITLYADSDYAYISPAATYGLEIENLFKTINHTLTAVGKRKLRFWLYHPLIQPARILQRQAAVTLLKEETGVHDPLQELLNQFPDIEKSISKLSCGYIHAKDILAVRNALSLLPDFQNTLKTLAAKNRFFTVEDIADLRALLDKTVNPEIPLSHPEGKIVKTGYNADLDNIRDIQEHGHQWLKDYQEREIKRTKINSLKVGFNKIFGYYIEITNANKDSAPADYIRKQTLVNGERFITPELKQYEEKILTAQDRILKIENEILQYLQKEILDRSAALHQFAQTIAVIDAIYSMTMLAGFSGYVAPQISDDLVIDIKDGRHPVVAKTLAAVPMSTAAAFVPNDTYLDAEENHLIILTGPNMAGKSTYIRQIAILVILAQMGGYVPAVSARIGVVDKIFTRIGAHDDINKGQSTFMVEMNETADILNNLTGRSLLILDEIGRGTSTYDGLSLAWALAEHLQKTKARTLFATHFHELTALADQLIGVKNYNVAVKEWKDEIIFLHKIIPGSTDDSYGIYVAKLAGIPKNIIQRSRQILTQLELKSNIKEKITGGSGEEQLSLFTGDPVLEEIKSVIQAMDINSLTPIEALNELQKMKKKLNEGRET